MTHFKGTPGVWSYRKHDLSIFAVPPKSNLAVPQITKWIGRVNQVDDWHANARLIAAAPELLETLQALVTAVTYAAPPKEYGTPEDPNPCFEARIPVAFIDEARDAIAKALGGTHGAP